MDCYKYIPHNHPDRLDRIPSSKTVFVCGNGDISFCEPEYTKRIITKVAKHPAKTFYFQSKRPEYFAPFLPDFPKNVILVTTMETNRDDGYKAISKAPVPSKRYEQFRSLNYPRKVVTIEPIADFDLEIFASWMNELQPEYVWLGFNSRPKQVQIPEPGQDKVLEFMRILKAGGIQIRGKELRGLAD
jgi:hypothetical protein